MPFICFNAFIMFSSTPANPKTELRQQICPLCHGIGADINKRQHFLCSSCGGIFLAAEHILPPDKEKTRYETHNNDVNDPGYQKFVAPIVERIKKLFTADQAGLDFGCGPGPVITKMLHDCGYDIVTYDPYFDSRPERLNASYDYIVCCEVIEHFCHPAEEFQRLAGMLKPGGRLICKTHLYEPNTDFSRWYYKNDETHVFIYQSKTIEFIAQTSGFSSFSIDGRLIEFAR